MNQFDCKKRRGSSVSQKEVVPSHVNTVADVTKLAVFSRVLVVGLQASSSTMATFFSSPFVPFLSVFS